MKIIQVAPYYYPAVGGVEEVVKQYSEGLVRKGHSVTVLTSQEKNSDLKELNGVKIERFASFGSSLPFSPILPILPLKLLAAKADIIHLHANKRFPTDAVAFVNLFKRVPLVFNPHAGQFGESLLGKLHNQTIGRISFAADLILTVSEFEKNLILKSGLKPKRIEVLPNGVLLKEFEQKRPNPFKNFDLKEKKIILFVGRLNFNKGLDTLIKAVCSNPSLVLFLIGPNVGEKENLVNLAEELKISDRVFFLGSLERAEIVGAYQHADIFCLPSTNEAFGLVLIEAMASHLPVVASNIGATEEIVENKKEGLLFKVNDPDDLLEKVNRILVSSELGKKLSQNAFEKVKREYDWEKIIARLENFYQEISE